MRGELRSGTSFAPTTGSGRSEGICGAGEAGEDPAGFLERGEDPAGFLERSPQDPGTGDEGGATGAGRDAESGRTRCSAARLSARSRVGGEPGSSVRGTCICACSGAYVGACIGTCIGAHGSRGGTSNSNSLLITSCPSRLRAWRPGEASRTRRAAGEPDDSSIGAGRRWRDLLRGCRAEPGRDEAEAIVRSVLQ